ncbi:hypothetical protein B0T22DRAFT_436827 [Podospora appendiculata]|uniref:Uncharacterized protein n=1 Tax=Podospora appendiculata TaxID=314037 RepID=A0AAE0XHW2_9PEZI|nr:hypothetical protein B0T22DRAFT_436827 [Podospora appendiculata]
MEERTCVLRPRLPSINPLKSNKSEKMEMTCVLSPRLPKRATGASKKKTASQNDMISPPRAPSKRKLDDKETDPSPRDPKRHKMRSPDTRVSLPPSTKVAYSYAPEADSEFYFYVTAEGSRFLRRRDLDRGTDRSKDREEEVSPDAGRQTVEPYEGQLFCRRCGERGPRLAYDPSVGLLWDYSPTGSIGRPLTDEQLKIVWW